MSKIKICGLTRECDIEAVNEAQPDYIGFVFAKSRRQVSREQAIKLRRLLAANIMVAGVFVNADIFEIAGLLDEGVIDIVQLHGQETESYIFGLRQLTDKPIVKAFSINCAKDLLEAADCSADFLLLDHGKGGSGISFDWQLLEGFKRDYFLAGGLKEDNVEKALKLSPYAVDLSSGVETNGLKDRKKIINIVRRVKA